MVMKTLFALGLIFSLCTCCLKTSDAKNGIGSAQSEVTHEIYEDYCQSIPQAAYQMNDGELADTCL